MDFPLPFLPAALWIIAAGCLIVLLIVLFAYHIYQRGRLRAVAGDAASAAALAAKKETLAAEVQEMREWLASQKGERLKLEAERHQQELARADMAQLERRLAEKKREGQAIMTRMADLDMALSRRKQFHSRLEAEIRTLETQREELEPMEKYAQELRLELDQGKMRLARLAQEEIRAQSLQTQSQLLKKEMADLQQGMEPLRQEREKLRQYLEKARHAAAVKNEQLLEQKQVLRAYELRNTELARQNAELEAQASAVQARHGEAMAEFERLGRTVAERQRQGEDLRQAVFAEQTQLEMLIRLRETAESENAALAARKALLERELEKLALPQDAPAHARRPRMRRRLPGAVRNAQVSRKGARPMVTARAARPTVAVCGKKNEKYF